eukprot:GHVL01027751.1.p1 GENE.GHVL01027751.1~~GHVL01027751.1.p1  ORF type:complete len:305 (+),score=56.74 GHVL01027751.1:166-1080(+)
MSNPRGLNNLGAMLFHGTGQANKDAVRAAELFKLAAEMGDVRANYNLGVCYETGCGVRSPDTDAALGGYRIAALKGHTEAESALGCLLHRLAVSSDCATPMNLIEAASWLRRASDKGDPEASYHLAMMYEMGQGVVSDVLLAFDLYQKSAMRGNLKAHTNLGNLYYSGGKGIGSPNPEKAFEHYKIAAEQGKDPKAFGNLGLLHERGIETDWVPDYEKAVEAYKKGIELGHIDSLVNLARLIEVGLIEEDHPKQAWTLLETASARGSVYAKVLLEKRRIRANSEPVMIQNQVYDGLIIAVSYFL